jgi:hypothetical protein
MISSRGLRLIDHSIDLDLRAPEAKSDFFPSAQFAQIQLTPPVQSNRTKEILDSIRLMLSVWPKLGQRNHKFRVGRARRCCRLQHCLPPFSLDTGSWLQVPHPEARIQNKSSQDFSRLLVFIQSCL